MLYVPVTSGLSTRDGVPGIVVGPPTLLRDIRGAKDHGQSDEAESGHTPDFSE